MNRELSRDELLAAVAEEVDFYRDLDNLPAYSANNLKIRLAIGGDPEPFRLNKSQKFLHGKLQTQLKDTGMVRTIIAKGRKLGCSTYVGARFYNKVSLNKGLRAFILTHRSDATDNLFDMVDRFHQNNNPLLKPTTTASNAKELSFGRLDSGYRVGTAGAAEVGRSETFQLLHGSEAAFWENADSIVDGLLQAVPLKPGTEVIFESTANGMLNFFAEFSAKARAKATNFEFIFMPWFWGEDHRLSVQRDFELSSEEREVADAYDLDLGQMVWRRNKMAELKEDWRFYKEYPATPEEAFQSSGEGTYIKPITVARARKAQVTPAGFVPIIIGIDPARGGRDSTAVIDRQGRRAGALVSEEWTDGDAMVLAGKIVKLIVRLKPKKIVIDATEGTGGAIYDRLCELNYGKLIEPVKFSGTAYDKVAYLNRRAEMWAGMKEWLENPVGVQIPDEDSLQSQICAPIWGPSATRHNSNGQLQIEPKEHIVKRLKRSPDMADALAMTFALPMGTQPIERPTVNTVPADSTGGY